MELQCIPVPELMAYGADVVVIPHVLINIERKRTFL